MKKLAKLLSLVLALGMLPCALPLWRKKPHWKYGMR